MKKKDWKELDEAVKRFKAWKKKDNPPKPDESLQALTEAVKRFKKWAD